MAIKTYNDQNFVAIANAIRAKNGETTQYKPSEMAPAIMAIESGLELLPQDTVSGAIANFPDGSNNYPVVELIANIDPKQAGSGDPSPSNVRPISGSTEVTIVKQGKNLITLPTYTENTPSLCLDLGRDITFSSVNFSFLATNAVAESVSAAIIDFQEDNGTHHYKTLNDVRDDNNIRFVANTANNGRFRLTYSNATFRYIYISYNSSARSKFTTDSISNWQLEVGSTVTDYEHYQAETKTIDLGRTVYGGTLNVTTGELTVDRAIRTFNGSEDWFNYANYEGFSVNMPTMKQGTRQDGVCNMLIKSTSSSQGQTNCFWLGVGTTRFYVIGVYASMGNTLEAFKEYLSGHNMTIVYPLNTPEVYQLTPEQVKTLLGVNNIYADTGDVEVTYRADIDLYIAKKIAEGA